jgi:hypothetical protein
MAPLLYHWQLKMTSLPVPDQKVLTEVVESLQASMQEFVNVSPDLRKEAKDSIDHVLIHGLSGQDPWTPGSWESVLTNFDTDEFWKRALPITQGRTAKAAHIVSVERAQFSELQDNYLQDCAEDYARFKGDSKRRAHIVQCILQDTAFKSLNLTRGQISSILRHRASRLDPDALASGDEEEKEEEEEQEMVSDDEESSGGYAEKKTTK